MGYEGFPSFPSSITRDFPSFLQILQEISNILKGGERVAPEPSRSKNLNPRCSAPEPPCSLRQGFQQVMTSVIRYPIWKFVGYCFRKSTSHFKGSTVQYIIVVCRGRTALRFWSGSAAWLSPLTCAARTPRGHGRCSSLCRSI